MADYFYQQDEILKRIIQNLRKSKLESDKLAARLDEDEQNRSNNLQVPKKTGLFGRRLSNASNQKMESESLHSQILKKGKLAPIDNAPDPKINGEFSAKDDLKEIQDYLKLDIAKNFNSNVLKIALNMREDRIAAIITAFYPVRIDEESINRACRSSQIEFL